MSDRRRTRGRGAVLAGALVAMVAVVSAPIGPAGAARNPAKLKLTPAAGPPTALVAVKGKYFGKDDVVTLTFAGTQVAVAHANGKGTFTTQFRVPSTSPPASATVQGVGTSGLSAKASFDVTTNSERFHVDGASSGLNPYENVVGIDNIQDLQKKWAWQSGGLIRSSPAVYDHVVYVGAEDGTVNAVRTDGSWLWTFQTGGAVDSSPDVSAGVVYVGSADHSVYALDAKTGNLKWSFATGGSVESSPDVDAALGMVFVGSDDTTIYALHTSDGSKVWSYPTGGMVISAPSVFKGRVYASSMDGHVYALDEANGSVLAKYAATLGIETAPALGTCLGYDWLIFGSDDHYVYAYDITNANKPIWADLTSGDVYATPAISCSESVVFLGTHDWRVQSTDLLTGAIKWWYNCAPQGRAVHSSPIVANGIVYFACLNGYIYALYSSQRGGMPGAPGAPDGAASPARLPVWQYTTGGAIYSGVTVSDGRVYVGSDDGMLYSFGLP